MATLNITYYARLAEDVRSQNVLVGDEPAIKREVVTYTTATQSAVFPENARFVRVVASADAYISVGLDPTATALSSRFVKDVVEYFGVSIVRNQPYRLSVYDGSS